MPAVPKPSQKGKTSTQPRSRGGKFAAKPKPRAARSSNSVVKVLQHLPTRGKLYAAIEVVRAGGPMTAEAFSGECQKLGMTAGGQRHATYVAKKLKLLST